MSAARGPVGVVGLGQIGGGVARALVRHGWAVEAYDVMEAATRALAPSVQAAPSAAAVAERAEVVLVAVLDDAQVRGALDGPAGILRAPARGQVIAILSTVDVKTVKWAGDAARRRGFAVVDCGVTGGAKAAEAGALVAMLGGEDAAVETVRPVVEAFSSRAIHVGALGAGIRLKLARNLVTYGSWMVAEEAARLAAAGGIRTDALVEVIRTSDPLTGGVTGLLAGNRGNRPGPRALTRIAEKDLRAALSLAESDGLDLPLARLAGAGIEGVIQRTSNGSDDD
jgi:3-hydroxyisobutyrate dehydrogenase-like beta-hydroxyacid dehydrogenase